MHRVAPLMRPSAALARCVGPRTSSVATACRVVSRGKLSSRASDFGGLEVFGKASIGNTDPYRVFAALQSQLQLS